jgi:hypothetical protein
MAKMSVAVRNTRLDAIETAIGTSPTLEVRTGAAPAATTDADSGVLLASMALPADWMGAAASGQKGLSGTWQDATADATGTPGHFRIKQGGTVHLQGSASGPGGGGEMEFDTASITIGQQVNVSAFTLIEGGA